jgi:choline dehydrogenase-like flavoprotein
MLAARMQPTRRAFLALLAGATASIAIVGIEITRHIVSSERPFRLTDAKRGVVDADCKVHGIENLYMAGNSVFPAVGYSNPTLTIVALTHRLADHLASRLR